MLGLFRTSGRFLCLWLVLLVPAAWAQDTETPEPAVEIENEDPWEGWNREVMRFNDTVDKYAIKPVAKGYRYIMPTVVDDGISNVFSTLWEIPSAGNALLQAKPSGVGRSLSRFAINATLGFFGIFDVATPLGIEKQQEDFGQTLAVWGVPEGPYVVLPFLGPSTARDAAALPIDMLSDPSTSLSDNVRAKNTIRAVKLIDLRADLIEVEALITGDRYVFLRNAYLQRRDYLVHDGEVKDTFGDGEDLDDEDWLEESEEF